MERYQVPAEKLRRRLDPATLPFKSTQEVSPLRGTLGQQRAREALRFGIGVEAARLRKAPESLRRQPRRGGRTKQTAICSPEGRVRLQRPDRSGEKS